MDDSLCRLLMVVAGLLAGGLAVKVRIRLWGDILPCFADWFEQTIVCFGGPLLFFVWVAGVIWGWPSPPPS